MALAKSKLNTLHAQYGDAATKVAHYRSLRGDGDPMTIKVNVEKELAHWEGMKAALASVVETVGQRKEDEQDG